MKLLFATIVSSDSIVSRILSYKSSCTLSIYSIFGNKSEMMLKNKGASVYENFGKFTFFKASKIIISSD